MYMLCVLFSYVAMIPGCMKRARKMMEDTTKMQPRNSTARPGCHLTRDHKIKTNNADVGQILAQQLIQATGKACQIDQTVFTKYPLYQD